MPNTKLLPQSFASDLGWSEVCRLAESLFQANIEKLQKDRPALVGVVVFATSFVTGRLEISYRSTSADQLSNVTCHDYSVGEFTQIQLYGELSLAEIEEIQSSLEFSASVLGRYPHQQMGIRTISNIPSIIYHAAELDGKWTLLYANEALTEMFGFPVSQFIGRHAKQQAIDFIHPDDRSSVLTGYSFARSTRKEVCLSYRIIDKEGKVRHVSEKVNYQKVLGRYQSFSEIWEKNADKNDQAFNVLDQLEDFTHDISLQTGQEFINHFGLRIGQLVNVDRVILCSKTKPKWWATWLIASQAVKEPNFHFRETDEQLYAKPRWDIATNPKDEFTKLLYGGYRYFSVLPIQDEHEQISAALVLCADTPFGNKEYISNLINLFGVRVLREITQCESKERQEQQNKLLTRQKHQLTQLVTLLGELDNVSDEAEFLSRCQHSFQSAFELSELEWLLWDSGDWLRCKKQLIPNKYWYKETVLVTEPTEISYLDHCRRTDELTAVKNTQQLYWPVGRSHAGFLVLRLKFCQSLPDEEVIQFSKNAIHLALQGLSQRKVLRRQAMRDSLTSLGNRSQLHAWMISSLPSQTQSALMLFDLNRFKEINDSFGHQFGDKLLREIGPRIDQSLRGETYYLSRLGGDEFALFYPNISRGGALEKAAMLHEALAQPYVIDQLTFQVEASVGVSFFPQHGADGHELLRCADVAMYASKSTGQPVTQYNTDLDTSTPHKIAVLSELDEALKSGQLSVVYQPLMDTKSGQTGGLEALVRWQHPEFGYLSPAEFIPISEMGEGIRKITDFVIRDAFSNINHWRELVPELQVSVNISPRVLLNQNFPQYIKALLEEYNVDGHSIVMELTESTLLVDPGRAIEIINSLASLNIEVEIDDFGTGYSSLSYLKQLPISALKIDRSFVADLLSDASDEVIVSSTIKMAHSLGLKTVAEGVEDEVTLVRLMRLGCDIIQGFYYAKPMPVNQVWAWLERNR